MTTNVLHSIDVHVPVRTAYNQWTQFESFPRFMDGVERDRPDHGHEDPLGHQDRGRAAGVRRGGHRAAPDERVAWTTENGTHQAGVVTFHRISDDTTRVTLQLDHDPQGLVEKAGDALGIIQRRVKGDLANFKEFIESRGAEEGGWRGDVDAPPQR
jgi:uncharacterized membrane protein